MVATVNLYGVALFFFKYVTIFANVHQFQLTNFIYLILTLSAWQKYTRYIVKLKDVQLLSKNTWFPVILHTEIGLKTWAFKNIHALYLSEAYSFPSILFLLLYKSCCSFA